MPLFTQDRLRKSARDLTERIIDLLDNINFEDAEATGDDLEMVADLVMGFPPSFAALNRSIIKTWKKDPIAAEKKLQKLLKDLRAFGKEHTARSKVSPRFIDSVLKQLRDIDINYDPIRARGQLEMIGDVIIMFGPDIVKQFNMAIRYCGTQPERAQEYLYGPSDIGSGNGLINDLFNLKEENMRQADFKQSQIDAVVSAIMKAITESMTFGPGNPEDLIAAAYSDLISKVEDAFAARVQEELKFLNR